MEALTAPKSLERLRRIAIFVPIVAVALLEGVVYLLYPDLSAWPGRLVLAGVVGMGLVFFYGLIFDVAGRMQAQLEHQNRELLALHHGAIDIYGELSLDVVLQKVVDQVRVLLTARYSAIAVQDESGAVREFVQSGIDETVRARLGEPPTGRGLFSVVLEEGVHLRLDDLTRDPRFTGFPEGHPPMRTLLAVPVLCKGPFRGNLYVTEKESSERFTDEDEQALVRFAAVSAIAIDNAYLHEQLRNIAVVKERELIAREMHDGMAQVLAYVNTKAQAVEGLLRRGRTEEAGRQLEQLAAASRDVYTDVREGILALRSQPRPGGSFGTALESFVNSWQDQSGVPVSLSLPEDVSVSTSAELQLLRIIQEALSNVRKHAGATRVAVEVGLRDGALVAAVTDDGCGFTRVERPTSGRPRFGLAIMRERAESIGAVLTLDSTPGKGTVVRVELPGSESSREAAQSKEGAR
jgi:nitrate/nitrite-specific signal transduction histidine kinase